jgi:hypothetical protein
METEDKEAFRPSRGMRNTLAFLGLLLLVPSLCVVAWAIWNHADVHGPIALIPGALLLGLILIGFAIRVGK